MSAPNFAVNLVLHPDNRGWIIEKMALKLQEQLAALGLAVTVSEGQRPDVDVNHYMSYAFANEAHATPATMFITHIDDPYKAAHVRKVLAEGVNAGICMSRQSATQLVELGVPRKSLCYALPAHDNEITARRIRVGITTRIYEDGRKREWLLTRLAQRMSLESFQFEIFGQGWEPVIEELRRAGAEVQYFPGTTDYRGDYRVLQDHLREFDYYLYTGMDEGSLGTLDAIAAGVRTIVTAQGFHLDLGRAISDFFVSYEELAAIFSRLQAERAERTRVATSLTWAAYAARHAQIWRAVLSGGELPSLEEGPAGAAGIGSSSQVHAGFWLRGLRPRRLLSALGHTRMLKPLRDAVRNAQRSRPRGDGK